MTVKARRDEENASCGGFWNSLDIGKKVSRICYVGASAQNVDIYVSGTWEEDQNRLECWQTYYGRAVTKPESYFNKASELAVKSSVNSVCCENNYVVAGLEDGGIEVCIIENEQNLKKIHSLTRVHGKFGGSTSVCIVDGEIVCGSDNGSLIRVDLSTLPARPTQLATDLNAVKCIKAISAHEFVSGHGSGQVHLWDVRQINPAITIGNLPMFSKAVSLLTDSILSIDSHPAQPNVIAYGTNSGSTAFIDVRQYKQPTPNLLKISQEPITDVKFHPSFPTNCFVLSGEGLLQLDLSTAKAEKRDLGEPYDEFAVKSRANVWLTAASWNLLDINQLGINGPKQLSAFAMSSRSILCGSNTNYFSLLTTAQFY